VVEDSDGLLLLGVVLFETNFVVSHRKIARAGGGIPIDPSDVAAAINDLFTAHSAKGLLGDGRGC
jgi:hypothetical protein